MSEPIIARQFWIRSPGHGEITRSELAPGGADDVLVHTRYSGVSRGTESLVFRGEVPPSQAQAMRAPFQEGEFPAPVKYGYTSVGDVLEGPGDVTARTVFCLFPHQDRYRVPVTAVAPLPDGLPPARAVLAATMETAVNVIWDARPTAGDRILVVGAGVVGLLCGWLCRGIPGAEVIAVDVNPARAPVAAALGLAFRTDMPETADADLVIHASGHPDGLTSAMRAAGMEATIVEASWYGNRSVPLPLGEAFHSRRLTLRSSQVGHLNPQRRPRWTHARRLTLALDLLCDSRLDVLITGESRFEELPEVMARLCQAPGDTLCHRIRY